MKIRWVLYAVALELALGLLLTQAYAADLEIGSHNAHRITRYSGNALCIAATPKKRNQLALLKSKAIIPGQAKILGVASTNSTPTLYIRYVLGIRRIALKKTAPLTRSKFGSVVRRCDSTSAVEPTATAVPTATHTPSIAPSATHTPLPTPTRTPTDHCSQGQFAIHWQVGGWPVVNFDTSAAPQIVRGKNAAMNTADWQAAFPWIDAMGVPRNGGIPQLADFGLHVSRVAAGVVTTIPDPNFDGYLMLDYEEWWPQWERTGEPYRRLSRDYVRSRYPNLDSASVEAMAIAEWEEAATELFLESLQTAKAVRPKAKVGFYALPWRSYTEYSGPNASYYRAVNDKAALLFEASDVIYPSIYMFYKSGGEVTRAQNEEYIRSNVREAERLAALNGHKEVLPYVMMRYHPSNYHLNNQFLTAEDLWLQIGFVRELGTRAEILWGWAPTNQDRDELMTYFSSTVVPVVRQSCLEQQ